MPRTPPKQAPMVHVRLNHEDLHGRIKDAAHHNGSTITDEINRRLQASFDDSPLAGIQADIRRLIRMHSER